MGTMMKEEAKQKLKEVNAFFGDQKGFVSLEDETLPRGWCGGTTWLECNLAIGALNYLDLEGLTKHLQSLDWTCIDCIEDVQLLVLEYGEGKFRIINVFTGTWIWNSEARRHVQVKRGSL